MSEAVPGAPETYGTVVHSRPPVYPPFDGRGSPDQIAGTTPDPAGRSLPVPIGTVATPDDEKTNYSSSGAPDQRRPGEGEVPANIPGYNALPPISDDGFDAVIRGIERELQEIADAQDARVDRDVAHYRGSIRPTVEAALDAGDARRKAYYADPERNLYKPEALVARDQAFEREQAAVLDALQAKLTRDLEAIAERKADAAPGLTVTLEDNSNATVFAASLSHMVPSEGRQVLADLLQDSAGDLALAYAMRPHLRSLYVRGGENPWRQDPTLYRVINVIEQMLSATDVSSGFRDAYDRTHVELENYFGALRDKVAGQFVRGMVASGTGRVGDQPLFFADAPVAAPATADDGTVESWRPYSGKVPRGKRLSAEEIARYADEA